MNRLRIIVNGFIIAAMLISFSGCGDDAVDTVNWQLVWEEDFEGTAGTLIDDSKWSHDLGNGCDVSAGCGWGNGELQYYSDRPENVSLDGNGNLAITSIKESYMGSQYSSARIITMDKFEQAYGRFEARIQLPFGQGIWPAFWMLGEDYFDTGWPQCGEIDIMEYRGQEPTIIHGSVHGPGYSGGNPVTSTYQLQADRFDVGFHVFAVEWFEDRIDYYVDDVFYQRITPDDASGEWVFDHSFYILLNVAVGGNFVGPPNNSTPFPQTMLIDYIRVYLDM